MTTSFADYVKEFEEGLSAKELAAFIVFRAHYEAENERLREALEELQEAAGDVLSEFDADCGMSCGRKSWDRLQALAQKEADHA